MSRVKSKGYVPIANVSNDRANVFKASNQVQAQNRTVYFYNKETVANRRGINKNDESQSAKKKIKNIFLKIFFDAKYLCL